MTTAGSLFSGIGGLDLAASIAGFDIRWQVENDPFCKAVLAKHRATYWPNAKLHGDIKHATNLAPVDLIFGGFPCQDVSNAAGRFRTGLKEGQRSGLWSEFARIVSEIRPRVVIVENVTGILSDAPAIIAELAKMDYVGQAGIISASDYGYTHIRQRWFVVAYADSIRDQIADVSADRENTYDQIGHYPADNPERDFACETVSDGQVYRANNSANESRMGIATDGVPEWLVRRVSNPYEAQKSWEAPRTTLHSDELYDQKIRALGNAVVPAQAHTIFELIYSLLEALS